jgi:acyl-CoA synthetase (AMP-forming)/AMP-acid ligase II
MHNKGYTKYIFIFEILEKRKIESVYAVPSTWKAILYYAIAEKKNYPFIKYINSGGEILNLQHYKQMKKIAPNSIIHNFYGPTEFTINVTCCEINHKNIINRSVIGNDNNFSIGKILPGISYKILKRKKKKIGELLLHGNQLMNGYLDGSKKNIYSINNKKYYMTGDIVKENKKDIYFF